MSHKAVYALLREIEDESSRNVKEELLEKLAADPLGLECIKLAYDPFITFGIRVGRRDEDARGSFPLSVTLLKTLCRKLSSRALTGNAAEAEVAETMAFLDDESAEILYRVLNKDLKCGIGEATINKVAPGVIPTFCVMRAHAFEEKRVKKWPVAVEPKLDGFRYTFIYRNGVGGFFTRSGKPAPSVDHVTEAVVQMANWIFLELSADDPLRDLILNGKETSFENAAFVLDGEMIAGEFNETSGALRRESEQAKNARFHVFDIMTWDDFDAVGSVGQPYAERRRMVDEFVKVAAVADRWSRLITKTPRYLCTDMNQVMTFYNAFRAKKLEGAMVKTLDGLYDKKKSYGWMKIKPEETEDLTIVGWFPGEPGTKYENSLGGLVVKRGDVLVRVGGGFSDAERDAFRAQIEKDIALADQAFVSTEKDATIVSTTVFGIKDQTKILFDLAEVEYHEVTPDGSLRHPRFVRLRTDKKGEVESKENAA